MKETMDEAINYVIKMAKEDLRKPCNRGMILNFGGVKFTANCFEKTPNNKKEKPDDVFWRSYTRRVFMNYPFWKVMEWALQAAAEAADEQWFEHKYPKGFFNENWVYPKKKKSVIKINLKHSRLKRLINENIKISDVAKGYGLKIKNNMAICPFHADSQASLGLDDTRNIYHCFGCNAKGDLIEFERRMKKLKGGQNK